MQYYASTAPVSKQSSEYTDSHNYDTILSMRCAYHNAAEGEPSIINAHVAAPSAVHAPNVWVPDNPTTPDEAILCSRIATVKLSCDLCIIQGERENDSSKTPCEA